jgi:hypothetical protein
MLTPRQIWTELEQFNDLEKDGNIIEEDFFDYLAENNFAKDFDWVIGNPPFKELSFEKFTTYKKKLTKFEKKGINLQVPRYQEALLFLSTSFLLLKKQSGKLCLIMKSGPFLYSGDEGKGKTQNINLAFRSGLFGQYNVMQIIDFTLLKNNLFRANVETAAVFIENKPSENDTVTHIVVRESLSIFEKAYFEISHYDFHKVPVSIAASVPYVWKCNLLGGAQVYHLVNRLKQLQKLGDYLGAKKTEGWEYGQGYKIGDKKHEDKEKFISGKNRIVDVFFKDNGVEKTEIEDVTSFETIPKNARLIFSPPHLVIKKTIGKNCIPMELRDDYLTFRNEVLGIHCPSEYRDELCDLATQLKDNNDILRFFIAATSARSGITRSMYTTDLGNILNLPLFKKEPFNLSASEQIIIDDVLNYYIDEFGKGKNAAIHKRKANRNEHIIPFSKVYCDALNRMYAKGGKEYYFSKLTEGTSFFACEYIFGNSGDVYKLSDENLDNLLYAYNPSHSVKYGKVMRIYGHDVIRLIKPKKLIYWLQSTALRDFGDTLEDALNWE